MITRATVYAVRMCCHIAEKGETASSVICAATNVPPSYGLKVLQALSRGGVLAATRGPRGGFALAREAEEVNLYEIVIACDGPITIGDGLPCPASDAFRILEDGIAASLESTTLASLAAGVA